MADHSGQVRIIRIAYEKNTKPVPELPHINIKYMYLTLIDVKIEVLFRILIGRRHLSTLSHRQRCPRGPGGWIAISSLPLFHPAILATIRTRGPAVFGFC